MVRVPRRDGTALAAALRAAAGERSAHKEAEPVTVRIDPVDLG
jgi:primosomal protein N' (replication factor Y)